MGIGVELGTSRGAGWGSIVWAGWSQRGGSEGVDTGMYRWEVLGALGATAAAEEKKKGRGVIVTKRILGVRELILRMPRPAGISYCKTTADLLVKYLFACPLTYFYKEVDENMQIMHICTLGEIVL